MINLFKISPTDASMVYLGQLFGSVSGVISAPGQTFGQINIISTLFKVFNGIVLTIAVLMLIYITVVGVISTAHEGEFMGKKWNNIWIPIRAVLGFALLVPTGAGYCGLQIVMMWIIVQGVGAADVLWNTALSYISTVGTYPQINLPSIRPATQLPLLFQGLACNATVQFNGSQPNIDTPGYYLCFKNKNCSNAVPSVPTPSQMKPTIMDLGVCGQLTFGKNNDCISNNTMLCDTATQAQAAALQSIVPVFSGIAAAFAEADYSYRDFYANSGSTSNANNKNWSWINQYCAAQNPSISSQNCCVQTEDQRRKAAAEGGKQCQGKFPIPDADPRIGTNASNDAVQMYWKYYPKLGPALGVNSSFIQTAVDYYMNALQGGFTTYIASQGQAGNLNEVTKQAASNGWILAGAYFWNLAGQTGKNFKQALPTLEWKLPSFATTDMYRNNYSAAEALINASIPQGGNAAGGTGTGAGGTKKSPKVEVHIFCSLPSILGLCKLDDQLSTGLSNIDNGLSATSTQVSTQGLNSLQGVVSQGQTMLDVADAIVISILVTLAILGLVGFISVFILGNSVTNPIGPTTEMIAIFLIPLIYGIIGFLVAMGGLQAVYLPLIPFMVFIFGVIHWFISVIETMVAGPLVALGIISPSGQHELLGKAEPALMLLFNVFLRPGLMVFGLIAALLLSNVVIAMFDTGWATMKSSGMATGMFGAIVELFAYTMIVVTIMNKCCSVINVLPSQVMRWIGGQAEGVETPMEAVKGGVEMGTGEVKGTAASVGGTAGKGVEKGGEIGRRKEEADKEAGGANAKGVSPDAETKEGKNFPKDEPPNFPK